MVDYRKVRPLGDRVLAEVMKPPLSDILYVPDTWGGSMVRVLASGSGNLRPEQEVVIDQREAVVLAGGYDSGSVVVFREDAVLAFVLDEFLLAAPGYIDVKPIPVTTKLVVDGIQDMRTNVFERQSDGHKVIASHAAGWVFRFKGRDYRFLSEGDVLAEEVA